MKGNKFFHSAYIDCPVMVALPSLFNAVILTSNITVQGFGESSCPPNAIVDLASKPSEDFPENLTWFKDGRRLGCSCDIRTCVSLCCASGSGQVDGWHCVDDNVAFGSLPTVENLAYKYLHPIVDNPCSFSWMAPSVLNEFVILPNGFLQSSDYAGGSVSDFEQYCLFRKPESRKFFAKVCRAWVRRDYWDVIALVVATVVMLTILIGFTIIPELNNNLHGIIFRCYVAAYIGTYLGALGAEFTTQKKTLPDLLYAIIETTTRYCGCCCIFWLNVMSFNIWRSFRLIFVRCVTSEIATSEERIKCSTVGFRSFFGWGYLGSYASHEDESQNNFVDNFVGYKYLRPVDNHLPKFERKLFISYAVYACLTPAIVIVIGPAVIIYIVPQFGDDVLRYDFKNWGCAAVTTSIFICNGLFYISTSLRIRQHKKDTAHLVQGVNIHHEVDRQWFNLYLKLFFVMGGHLLIWPIWFVMPTPEITHVFAFLEVLQSLLVFVIFLWKPQFKLLVFKRSKSSQLEVHSSNKSETSEAARD